MGKQGFHTFSFWIIICSSVWWALWFYLAAFGLINDADRLRKAVSVRAAGVARSPSSDHDHHDHGGVAGELEDPRGRKGGNVCNGRYVYMYTLPPQFNRHFLKACDTLSAWTNMCPHIANCGLGQPLSETSSPWFATNQFTAEVIFHERMKRYSCLTSQPSKATAFYVPFYAGFDMSSRVREQNLTARDRRATEVVQFLRKKGNWERMWGRDHFLVMGRITWDFMRENESPGAWGNTLLLLPEVKNMSALLIEAHPWHHNEHGIPYPSYFHPWNKSEVERWQSRMRCKRREILFSFAGAPRPGLDKAAGSMRANILAECSSSPRCEMLNCEKGGGDCHNPKQVMQLFTNSVFCVQPQGDSFTRRSIFDSMLAGCIPVFFTEHSAYTQYQWHLPRNRTSYSVFIPEESVRAGNVSIANHLSSLAMPANRNEIESMRRQVIALIPSLIYADPRHSTVDFADAFDLAVNGVLEKISQQNTKLNELSARQSENGKLSKLSSESARARRKRSSNSRKNNAAV